MSSLSQYSTASSSVAPSVYSTASRHRSCHDIFDLITADQDKSFHMGKRCKPLTETLFVKRNGKKLHRWRRAIPPTYFRRVEKNSGADSMYRKTSKKSSAVASTFSKRVFERVLHPDILRYTDTFGKSRIALHAMLDECLKRRNDHFDRIPVASPLKEWLPAGIDGGIKNNAKLPKMAVSALKKTTVRGPGVAFGGESAYTEIGKEYYGNLHQCHHKLLDGDYLMTAVFNLSKDAETRIANNKSTMLREVHEKTNLLRAHRPPSVYEDGRVVVGEEEDVFEIKLGVYFVPAKGKVYKFLTKPVSFPEFFSEVSVGLYIEEASRGGVCGVKRVCPEHFCFEMDYSGPNLDLVLRGTHNLMSNDPVSREMSVYNVIMMQSTPGQYNIPLISGLLKRGDKSVRDSTTATGILGIFRRNLLDNIPFFLAQAVNVITGLGQQGLVNIDIKVDNFVMSGIDGSPRMIDLNIVLPSGHKDPPSCGTDFSASPQTPPEFLKGRRCYESSMSYSLAHMLKHLLKTLSEDQACACLHFDLKLSEWIANAYTEVIADRPPLHMAAVYIGNAFPFNKKTRSMFLKPLHTYILRLKKDA
jgi:hypothetical protein